MGARAHREGAPDGRAHAVDGPTVTRGKVARVRRGPRAFGVDPGERGYGASRRAEGEVL